METNLHSLSQQLPYLLPTQFDFDTIKNSGVTWVTNTGKDKFTGFVEAVRRLMRDIIKIPDDAELWLELSQAFGLLDERAWICAFMAHRLAPDNPRYLEALNSIVKRSSGISA